MLYIKYMWYLLKHKYYVFKACWELGRYVKCFTHDLSKFLPDEFIPYARYFYGKRDPVVAYEFEQAWLKHIHRNPHHWEHWVIPKVGTNTVTYMPPAYAEEMVCDWYGAGMAISGKNDVLEYFNKTKPDKLIHFGSMETVIRTVYILGPKQYTTIGIFGDYEGDVLYDEGEEI